MEFEPTKEDLQQLREWVKKMPHIIQEYDDPFLAAFIRASKRSLHKTKIWLENFNALLMRYPDFFGSLDPLDPLLQETLSTWLIFPLPKKTPDDSTVIMTCLNLKSNDASKSHIRGFYRYILLTVYVLMREDDFGSGQVKLVSDVKGASFAHFKELTPVLVKQVVEIAESGIPVRVKSGSTYNATPILEQIFNLFKLFAKKKLADRLNVCSTIDKLSEEVPKKMLPKEYGGGEESVFVLHDNWKKKVESYRQRFLEEERMMRELDQLRPRRDEADEMVGTFRQLNVD